MKVKFGMMMVDGRGKLGGQVASKNRSGSYVRTKVTPSNPRTIFQMAGRQVLASFSKNWSGLLTDAQRASWNEAANSDSWNRQDIFGDSKRPTGKNLYTSVNMLNIEAGLPAITAVPEKVSFPELTADPITWDLSDNTVTSDISYEPLTGGRLVIKATPPLTAGTSFYKGKTRKILVVDSDGSFSDIEAGFASGYIARFGTPTEGANIRYQMYLIKNGQRSVSVEGQVIVNP